MLVAVVFAWLIVSLYSGREFITHDCTQLSTVIAGVSPSLCPLLADRHLQFPGDRVYLPRCQQSQAAVFVAMLLLLGGVETNPGLPTSPAVAGMQHGIFNVRSAVNKIALIHDRVSDWQLDMLAVTETWMKASHPAAITHGLAPTWYRVLHRHHEIDDSGGVALVTATSCRRPQCHPRAQSSTLTSWSASCKRADCGLMRCPQATSVNFSLHNGLDIRLKPRQHPLSLELAVILVSIC